MYTHLGTKSSFLQITIVYILIVNIWTGVPTQPIQSFQSIYEKDSLLSRTESAIED